MKRLLPILFLLCAAQGFSQELLDSAFWEMEDSISGMSIVPVKKPKELLDSIIEQVILDSQQKPIRCKYQVMQTSGLHTSRPTTSSCIFYAVANIRIKSTGRGEKFRFDGPRPLRNLNDTTYAYYDLRDMMEGQYILWIVQTNAASEGVSVFQSFQKLMRMHYIKVYSISDEKGRGVYRVDFSPRKNIGYGFCARKYNGTAYFDRNFHIKQIETDKIVPSSYDITGRQDKDGLLSHITCQHYRMDFEEIDGTTVVKKIESSSSVDNQIMGKYTVQRLP